MRKPVKIHRFSISADESTGGGSPPKGMCQDSFCLLIKTEDVLRDLVLGYIPSLCVPAFLPEFFLLSILQTLIHNFFTTISPLRFKSRSSLLLQITVLHSSLSFGYFPYVQVASLPISWLGVCCGLHILCKL